MSNGATERLAINEAVEVLTLRQVAAELGITCQAVRKAVREGRLAASVVAGRHRRCTRADVEAWLTAREARRTWSVERRQRLRVRAAPDPQSDALYDHIVAFKREHGGRSPTRAEMAAAMGMGSTSAVQYRLVRLAREGRIVLDGSDARNIVIPGERWLAPGECMEGYSG